ncbi:MAG TPA: CoA-binding protein [Symbiobacteriaceae bacterium]
MNSEAVVRWIFGSPVAAEGGEYRPRTIAVVGLSDKPDRPSYGVARFLQEQGFKIVPVTPKGEYILGEPVYRSLAEIPFPVDIVDVFRAPEHVPGVLADVKAMAHKPRILWLQEGVIHDEAAAGAVAYGLHTIMDRCMLKEARRVRR